MHLFLRTLVLVLLGLWTTPAAFAASLPEAASSIP